MPAAKLSSSESSQVVPSAESYSFVAYQRDHLTTICQYLTMPQVLTSISLLSTSHSNFLRDISQKKLIETLISYDFGSNFLNLLDVKLALESLNQPDSDEYLPSLESTDSLESLESSSSSLDSLDNIPISMESLEISNSFGLSLETDNNNYSQWNENESIYKQIDKLYNNWHYITHKASQSPRLGSHCFVQGFKQNKDINISYHKDNEYDVVQTNGIKSLSSIGETTSKGISGISSNMSSDTNEYNLSFIYRFKSFKLISYWIHKILEESKNKEIRLAIGKGRVETIDQNDWDDCKSDSTLNQLRSLFDLNCNKYYFPANCVMILRCLDWDSNEYLKLVDWILNSRTLESETSMMREQTLRYSSTKSVINVKLFRTMTILTMANSNFNKYEEYSSLCDLRKVYPFLQYMINNDLYVSRDITINKKKKNIKCYLKEFVRTAVHCDDDDYIYGPICLERLMLLESIIKGKGKDIILTKVERKFRKLFKKSFNDYYYILANAYEQIGRGLECVEIIDKIVRLRSKGMRLKSQTRHNQIIDRIIARCIDLNRL